MYFVLAVILSFLQAVLEIETRIGSVRVCVGVCFLYVTEVCDTHTGLFSQCLTEYECEILSKVPPIHGGICSFLLRIYRLSHFLY